MFDKYYPIEIDQHMSVDDKIPLMIEWYDKKITSSSYCIKLKGLSQVTFCSYRYDGAHELLRESDLNKQDFALMVKESPLEFRYNINDTSLGINYIQVFLIMDSFTGMVQWIL